MLPFFHVLQLMADNYDPQLAKVRTFAGRSRVRISKLMRLIVETGALTGG